MAAPVVQVAPAEQQQLAPGAVAATVVSVDVAVMAETDLLLEPTHLAQLAGMLRLVDSAVPVACRLLDLRVMAVTAVTPESQASVVLAASVEMLVTLATALMVELAESAAMVAVVDVTAMAATAATQVMAVSVALAEQETC